MKNCDDCKFVSITEEQQKVKYQDHICTKHGMRVIHQSNNPKIFHDYIYPCIQCCGRDFESR